MRRTAPLLVIVFLAAGVSCERGTTTRPDGAERTGPTIDTVDPTSPVPAQNGSLLGDWKLESGRGPEGDIPIVEGWDITLQITDGRIGGRSGCNSYGGRAVIEGASFDVGGFGGTLIGCEGEVALSEERYTDAIQRASSIRRTGETLQITGDEVELVFRSLPPPPVAQLVGTTWELQTVVGSDGTKLSVIGEPATLRLERGLTFTGATGCRPLKGRWLDSVGEIHFNEMHARGRCPEELSVQDSYVVGILGDGFKATVTGRQLTIVNVRAGGTLVYEAE